MNKEQLYNIIKGDRILFNQLYDRMSNEGYNPDVESFGLIHGQAIMILEQKLTRSKELLQENQEQLARLDQKPLYNCRGISCAQLKVNQIDITNIQAKSFLYGSFAVQIKLGNEQAISEYKPSYDLSFIRLATFNVVDIGEELEISILNDSGIAIGQRILLQVLSMEWSQAVIESLTQSSDGELISLDLHYEVVVLDQSINQQIIKHKNRIYGIIQECQDEIFDYTQQLSLLHQMNVYSQDEFRVVKFDPEQSGTYSIAVPEYYKKPLEVKATESSQLPHYYYEIINALLLLLSYSGFSYIAYNTTIDMAVTIMILFNIIKTQIVSPIYGILLILTILPDSAMIYLSIQTNAYHLSTQLYSLDPWATELFICFIVNFLLLQIMKIYVIIKLFINH